MLDTRRAVCWKAFEVIPGRFPKFLGHVHAKLHPEAVLAVIQQRPVRGVERQRRLLVRLGKWDGESDPRNEPVISVPTDDARA